MIDDDALDRALAALPLEEPPPGLHDRIMAATVYRQRAVVRPWELWLLTLLSAIVLYLVWTVAATPHLAERVTDGLSSLVEAGGLTSVNTLLWLAVGVSAAWWLSQLSIPARGRIENR